MSRFRRPILKYAYCETCERVMVCYILSQVFGTTAVKCEECCSTFEVQED